MEKDGIINGPIILLDNIKVIGIKKELKNNNGILLKEIIKEFNRENEEEKNEINLIIKINEDEIHKNI